MERKRVILIGIVLAISYYLADSIIDFLVSDDYRLLEMVITNIPVTEIFNRVAGMLMVIAMYLMFHYFNANKSRITSDSPADEMPDEDELKAFLSSYTMLEMVSMQVKTTMNTVLGFLNLSKDDRLSQQTKGIFTDYVYTSSSGLLQLFNSLTELYQSITNSDIRTTQRIDINGLLGDLNTKYRTELKYRQGVEKKLILHIPGIKNKQMLTIDKSKLTSMLEALLQNAIEFSGEGMIEFGYSVQRNRDLTFFFHSSSSNISQAQLESRFKTFMRNPGGRDINVILASLRLELAKRLAKQLDARLGTSSKNDSYSGFYVTLTGERQKKTVNGESLMENSIPNWNRYHILIAEDVDSNYFLLKSMLERTKIKIERAVNGLEAIELFKQYSEIDLVLMDIMMPQMDGFEAASSIKNLDNSVPIIGQTAYCLESEDVEGKLEYFDDFLTKPIWDHELLRTLSKYLPKHKK